METSKVYLVGPKGSNALNSYEHITNDPMEAARLLGTFEEGEMKSVTVKPKGDKGDE